MNFTTVIAQDWLHKMNDNINDQQNYLTALDEKIGDGDHGINMARGFQMIVEHLNNDKSNQLHSIADIMKMSAKTLMTTVGGAAGILYATAFLKMAAVYENKRQVNYELFTKGLERTVQGIKHRGKVEYNEKTLLDVWVDVFQLFKDTQAFPSASSIEATAKQAMLNTKQFVATKGKASLYEENSVGHVDPGAASTYYLFVSLAEICKEYENE